MSVRSQADAEGAVLDRERKELATDVESERKELAQTILIAALSPNSPVRSHSNLWPKTPWRRNARDELGISKITAARPLEAAAAPAASFARGIVPIIIAATAPSSRLSILISAGSIILLAFLGAVGAKIGGANMLSGAVRVGFWGAAAMAVKAFVGSFVGASL